jgi:hypothetical protein
MSFEKGKSKRTGFTLKSGARRRAWVNKEEVLFMRIRMMAMIIAIIGLNFTIVGCIQNASERRAASPTIAERFKQDSITGRVNDIGPKHVSIKDDMGETRRVRVDDQTKMDRVIIGDQVKAFVSDDGYASTIQRAIP